MFIRSELRVRLWRTLVWKNVTTEKIAKSIPATNQAALLPAKLQNAKASSTPQTKIIRRAVQYFLLISLRVVARRSSLAICFSSCTKRIMPPLTITRFNSDHKRHKKFHAHGWVGHSESWTESGAATGVVCSLPKVVIKATEQTMIAAAMSIRKVNGSPATSQPSNTATTGFTYA